MANRGGAYIVYQGKEYSLEQIKEIDKEETQNIDTAYSNDCVISLKSTKYIKKRKII